MWVLQPDIQYAKRRDRWPKKYRREFVAVHDNLDTFLTTLNQGVRPEQAKRYYGFVHAKYSRGLLSIDQKGGGSGLKETRLYVYPDESIISLFLITLGDKKTQAEDVRYCDSWLTEYLERKGMEKHDE